MKIEFPFLTIQVNDMQHFDLLFEPELLEEVHQAVKVQVSELAIEAIFSHITSWRDCGNINKVDFYSTIEEIKQFNQHWIDLLEVYATGGCILLSPTMLTMLQQSRVVSYTRELSADKGPTSAIFVGKLTILEGEQIPVYVVFNPEVEREDIIAIGDVKYEAIFNVQEDGELEMAYFIPPENLDKIASVSIV